MAPDRARGALGSINNPRLTTPKPYIQVAPDRVRGALGSININNLRLTTPKPCIQVAPDRVRGALGSINQLVICIGIVAALVVNVMVPAESWRSMFLLATVPAAALGLGAPACKPSSLACSNLYFRQLLLPLCGDLPGRAFVEARPWAQSLWGLSMNSIQPYLQHQRVSHCLDAQAC